MQLSVLIRDAFQHAAGGGADADEASACGAALVDDARALFGNREKFGVHHRFKRGYRNVINESIRLNAQGQDSQLAIETSGHGAFKENYFLDDGAYIVTKLLIELARGKKEGYSLESMIATLEEPAESIEFRMNILLEDFKPYGQQVIDELNEKLVKKQACKDFPPPWTPTKEWDREWSNDRRWS